MLYLLICFLQRLNKITIFLNCYFVGFLQSCILFLIAVNHIFWERKRSALLRMYYTQPQLTTEAFEIAKDPRERINRAYSDFKPGRASWWSGNYVNVIYGDKLPSEEYIPRICASIPSPWQFLLNPLHSP